MVGMLEGRTDELAVLEVPQPRCLVTRCTCEDTAIWRNRNVIDRSGVPRQNRNLLPYPNFAIV
jgi:hypothetical protein